MDQRRDDELLDRCNDRRLKELITIAEDHDTQITTEDREQIARLLYELLTRRTRAPDWWLDAYLSKTRDERCVSQPIKKHATKHGRRKPDDDGREL